MNNYRVDRNDSEVRTPCGMNSLLYLGDSWDKARQIFNAADVGLDAWNQPNSRYGVTLSVWNDDKRDYIIKCMKGVNNV